MKGRAEPPSAIAGIAAAILCGLLLPARSEGAEPAPAVSDSSGEAARLFGPISNSSGGAARLFGPMLTPERHAARLLASSEGAPSAGASVTFHVDPSLSLPEAPLTAWAALSRIFLDAAGSLPSTPPPPVRLRSAASLPSSHAGASVPGLVELRPGGAALRHELAHQLLFWACPVASADRLFHEAFALAAAGELGASDGPYQSLPVAVAAVREGDLDRRATRQALRRVLLETLATGAQLPTALVHRLRECGAGGRWEPVTADELASPEGFTAAAAAVVLGRHSGEVLIAEGAARRALPFGSTLKPFVVAAIRGAPPVLPAERGNPDWLCGEAMPATLDAAGALARSCNGWFHGLDAKEPDAHRLGPLGAALLRLGLSRLPASLAEAIGLQPSLQLSPWALAQAYRLLAEARPDLIEALRQTAQVGTLAGLPESPRLRGLALKTGTVRDAGSRPRLGLIVAVDDDFVIVRTRAGRAPRSFAADVLDLVARARGLAGSGGAQVQVFGLLDPNAVEARCPGVGVALASGPPALVAGSPELIDGFRPLRDWLRAGPAVCLAAPFRVRFPGLPPEGRDYAGVFRWSTPAPDQHAPGRPRTDRERRARRGSDFLFRTTRLLYAAGVADAEASSLHGEPRAALVRVAAHDERHSRHPGRPVCDTTHCQVFQGTSGARPADRDALSRPALPWARWLHFSAGGQEGWEEQRPAAQVDAALGAGVKLVGFQGGRASVLVPRGDGEAAYETAETTGCESVRAALRLPSCPERFERDGAAVRFFGHGQGHGVGLDLDAAAKSGLDQDALLRRAFEGEVAAGSDSAP